MRSSKGGLTHSEIMRLSWRQFGTYLDAFTWLLSQEDEESRGKVEGYDLQAKKSDPAWKSAVKLMREETKREVAKHKKFAETNPTGGVSTNMLEAE